MAITFDSGTIYQQFIGSGVKSFSTGFASGTPCGVGIDSGALPGATLVLPPAPTTPAPAHFIIDRFWAADQYDASGRILDLSGNGGHLVPSGTQAALVDAGVQSGRQARLFTGNERYNDTTYSGNFSELVIIHIAKCTYISNNYYTAGSPNLTCQSNGMPNQYVDVGPTANNSCYSPTTEWNSFIYRSCLQNYAHQGYANGSGNAWVAPSAAAINGFCLGGATNSFQGYWLATVVGRLTGGLYPSGGANWFMDDGTTGSTGADNQLGTILDWANTNYFKPPATDAMWALSGNSITCSSGISGLQTFTNRLRDNLPGKIVVSMSVPANGLSFLKFIDPFRIDTLFHADRPLNGIALIFEPSNQFLIGTTAADVYTMIQDYDTARVNSLFTKRVYSTCIPRSDANPAVVAEINSWNSMMRSHFATPLTGAPYGTVPASGWGSASGSFRAALFDAAQVQIDYSLGYLDGVHPDATAASVYANECSKVMKKV